MDRRGMWLACRGNTDPQFSEKFPLCGTEIKENIYDFKYMKSKVPLYIF